VLTLFEGEKTSVFWAGLIFVGVASVILFQTVWGLRFYTYMISEGLGDYIVNMIPNIVGSIVFVLIGLYMMKSGVKKNQPQ